MDRKTKKLVDQLQSDDPKERYLAVVALAKLKDLEVLPHIDKLATLDSDKRVRDMAYKAVRMLEILQKEQEDTDLRRQIMEIDEQDDSSDDTRSSIFSSDFDDVEDDKTQVSSRVSFASVGYDDDDDDDDDLTETGSYTSAELGIYELDFDDEPKSSIADTSMSNLLKDKSKKSAKENKRGTTFVFRMILWLSVVLAIITLGVVAERELNSTEPDSTEEAVTDLDGWHEDMLQLATRYTIELSRQEFDCASFNAGNFEVPTQPEWTENEDSDYRADFEDFLAMMTVATESLDEANRLLTPLCDRSDGALVIPSALKPRVQTQVDNAVLNLNLAKSALNAAD